MHQSQNAAYCIDMAVPRPSNTFSSNQSLVILSAVQPTQKRENPELSNQFPWPVLTFLTLLIQTTASQPFPSNGTNLQNPSLDNLKFSVF